MREAVTLLLAGLVAGAVLSVAAARSAATLLYGLTPTDPATLASAVVLLAAVAALAGYLPAWRASRLNPTIALHDE
jgi:ABC-type antimicrobial peptide transport system permease subunit